MTSGEAKQLETDVIIFPMEINRDDQQATIEKTVTETATVEKTSIKTNVEIRFARLKKSLRKRSANIL